MPQQQIEKVYLVLWKADNDTFMVEAFRKESKADDRAKELWIKHDQNIRTLEMVVK